MGPRVKLRVDVDDGDLAEVRVSYYSRAGMPRLLVPHLRTLPDAEMSLLALLWCQCECDDVQDRPTAADATGNATAYAAG